MASPNDLYVKAIHERFGYFGTWLPNAPVGLGDVGLVEGCSFRRVSSLAGLGIAFGIRTSANPMRFHYTRHAEVTAGAGVSAAAGVPSAGGSAEVHIGFQRDGAFVFQAEGCVVREIEDRAALGRAVTAEHAHGNWDARWAVIDAVVEADSATILLANSGGSSVELSAGVHLPEVIDQLARAGLDLRVRSQRGDVLHFLVEPGLVPMFRVARPRQSALGRLFSAGEKSVTFRRIFDDEPAVAEPDEFWERLAPEA